MLPRNKRKHLSKQEFRMKNNIGQSSDRNFMFHYTFRCNRINNLFKSFSVRFFFSSFLSFSYENKKTVYGFYETVVQMFTMKFGKFLARQMNIISSQRKSDNKLLYSKSPVFSCYIIFRFILTKIQSDVRIRFCNSSTSNSSLTIHAYRTHVQNFLSFSLFIHRLLRITDAIIYYTGPIRFSQISLFCSSFFALVYMYGYTKYIYARERGELVFDFGTYCTCMCVYVCVHVLIEIK